MIDRTAVAAWLERYIHAWKTYDPGEIGSLFAEDVSYHFSPYSQPVIGREAVVASWLENQDAPGTWEAHYEPVAVDGNTAVATGYSRYFEADGKTFRAEWSNLYVIRFNDHGECVEFSEWYMKKP